jgi:hypothetical protein
LGTVVDRSKRFFTIDSYPKRPLWVQGLPWVRLIGNTLDFTILIEAVRPN